MDKKLKIRNSTAEFLTFTIQAQEDGIEVRLQDETVWLTQKQLCELYQSSKANISEHIKNIFLNYELIEDEHVGFSDTFCSIFPRT